MLKYLIQKEFKQFFRNRFLPKLVILMPCAIMLILPWAANLEIKNIDLAIVDSDRSTFSKKLALKAAASEYFNYTGTYPSYNSAMEEIKSGTADIILEIPAGFERNLIKENRATVLISANTVNGTKGGMGSNYLMNIITGYSMELQEEAIGINAATTENVPVIELKPLNRFNPHMDYKIFMVPALMVMLVTLLCGFLPALNIVGEKESGTIEQINVTPVNKFIFIISKLIPYWIIGFIVLTLGFIIARTVYGLTPAGSLFAIYGVTTIYILVVSGFGLVISNYSDTMQQAMFVMFFFMLIFILLSGLYTPVNSMPEWAQVITIVNPLKYFMHIIRHIYLKGSSFSDIIPQVYALCIFAVISNTWAIISYKKSS